MSKKCSANICEESVVVSVPDSDHNINSYLVWG